MGQLDVLSLAPLPCRLNGRPFFQNGGSLYLVWLLRGLVGLGHRVRALGVGPPPAAGFEPGEVDAAISVEWFAVEWLDTVKPPPADEVEGRRVQFELALDRALAEGRPDLVILGNEHHAWYATEACRQRALPTILIAHGVPTAGLPDIYPPAAIETLAGRLGEVDLIVAVGAHLEAILRRLGVERVQTIPTGIDTHAFRPRPKDPGLLGAHRIDRDAFVVGSFAHQRPEKRVLDVVRSAELVLRSEPGAVYLVAADGPLREAMIDLAEASGVGASFRFLGELAHGDVPAHIALCDAVVLASEREGYSLVSREVQASGGAMIVSDIPGGREVVDDGETGLLFRLGDPADLAAKTLVLARDEELRHTLGAKARASTLGNGQEGWLRAWSTALEEAAGAGKGR